MSALESQALALVRDGWSHLREERPLAAWSAWMRAQQLDPDSEAASAAREQLASAENLPPVARRVRAFEYPESDAARSTWNRILERPGENSTDLEIAQDGFEQLIDIDPVDAAAWYNLALCHAWRGENRDAIDALEHVLRIQAASRFEKAVDAWLLAGILRVAVPDLADDFNDELVFLWPRPDLDPLEALAAAGVPLDGARPESLSSTRRVAAWLDRVPPPATVDLVSRDLCRVLAFVVHDLAPERRGQLSFMSARPGSLVQIEKELQLHFGGYTSGDPVIERISRPLPISLLDSAAFAFRIPEPLDPEHRARLLRGAISDFYERDPTWWDTARPTLAFDDELASSPRQAAARLAASRPEDPEQPVLRARLEALVRLREELAARPTTRGIAGGYRFDRLRVGLGLEPHDPRGLEEIATRTENNAPASPRSKP